MAEPANPKIRHFTTRPGFAILVGLLVLTLYFIWAAYGAAPTSLRFLAETQSQNMAGMAQAGHGGGTGGMTADEFHEITVKFAEDLGLPDGSVRPTRQWMASMAAMGGEHEDREDEAAHTASSEEMTPAVAREEEEGHGPDEGGEPIDVYLMAMQFSYTPNVLRLEQGVPYRFRMMSMDVNHGASLHTGFAGHIMRRPAHVMMEMVMTFPEPGEYMIYCTVYCGEGHSQMKGKIIVE
jgi:heme/copper-type cytochrome/quinol oxidase subunit 2